MEDPPDAVTYICGNEYKYAVKIDSVLSILIQAKVLLKEGEEMLYIRMEDDGVGFPEQVMQYMNFESEDPSGRDIM